MSLEVVSDDLDDAIHVELDQAVLQTLEDVTYNPLFVLTTIVSNSAGRLDPKYLVVQDAKALLQEHPDLATMLARAWEGKEFKEIRNLSALPSSR
jgi:hypothetical protein